MDKSQKFFFCSRCGNVAVLAVVKGGVLTCCGEEMSVLSPNTVEASQEKHLPVVETTDCGIKVKVGGVSHPMQDEHHIDFIYVQTEHGGQRVKLEVGDSPEAEFCFVNDKPTEVYAYCNLHGMWKTEI